MSDGLSAGYTNSLAWSLATPEERLEMIRQAQQWKEAYENARALAEDTAEAEGDTTLNTEGSSTLTS